MSAQDRKPSILIIEDEIEVAKSMAELMETWGYQVVLAETLPSAQIKVSNQKFSIILLDLMLKKVSGLKLLEQIRRNMSSMNNVTPIILHSGNLDTELITRFKTDINDALVKPSPADLIREKVDHWATKKHSSTNNLFTNMKMRHLKSA